MAGDQDIDRADWKQKYFNHLELYEAEEERWAKAEEVFRRSLSRMSLVAEGLSPELDAHMAQLRQSVRKGDDATALAGYIEQISQSLTELESQEEKLGMRTPADALAALFARVTWSKALRRRSKKLQKQLKKAKTLAQLPPLLDESVALLQEGIEAAVSSKQNDQASLWQKLVKKEQDVTSDATSVEEAELDSSLALATTVLGTILRVMDVKSGYSEAPVTGLEEELAKAASPEEIKSLASDLASLVAEKRGGYVGQAQSEDIALDPDSIQANELFIQFLESLSLPEELDQQAVDLREKLSSTIEIQQWPFLINEMCDLIAVMRRNVQEEKKDLEQFLSQLTGQLKMLDDNLRGAESERDQTHTSGQALDSAVKAEVSGLATSIQDAVELDELKREVQVRLEQISKHMDAYRQDGERQHREAKKKMAVLNERLHGFEAEATALRSRIQEQRERALVDSLTGVANRLAFDERFEMEYQRWTRFQEPVSILLWDIDSFKKINDTYGHKAGDRVLEAIAKLLASQIREVDFIARYGGEEFVIIAPGADAKAALGLAEKLRSKVEARPFHHAGTPVAVTVSCGIAEFKEYQNAEAVFEAADKRLYQAKEQGRNRCVYMDLEEVEST